jgi:DnaJ-class molecular chaperone
VSEQLDQLDYYELFGVATDASVDDIKRAFHAFARKYHPDRYVASATATRDQAAEIYRRGTEAYRVLTTAQKRQRYDAALPAGKLRYDAAQDRVGDAGASRAKAKLSPKARPFVQKAEQAQKSGDLKTAKLNLQIALKHDPENEDLGERLAQVERALAR